LGGFKVADVLAASMSAKEVRESEMKRIGYWTLAFALSVALLSQRAWSEKRIDQATLKDLQPTNFAVAKKKHQQYDFTLLTVDRSYSCRTSADKKLNATNFPVGSTVTFSSSGKNGEVKTTDGKSAKCMITRVAALSAAP
jgi:hypothetical protein